MVGLVCRLLSLVSLGGAHSRRKPMRNAQFAKDEALFAARRLMRAGSLSGRKPDVETEV